MNREERITSILTMLNRLVNKGIRKDTFVIFENPKTALFVQCLSVENELLCDVPLSGLNHETVKCLKSLSSEKSRDGQVADGSYQIWFHVDDIEKATEYVDNIFLKVFKLPTIYTITSELGSFECGVETGGEYMKERVERGENREGTNYLDNTTEIKPGYS